MLHLCCAFVHSIVASLRTTMASLRTTMHEAFVNTKGIRLWWLKLAIYMVNRGKTQLNMKYINNLIQCQGSTYIWLRLLVPEVMHGLKNEAVTGSL
jgi:hypothetical protein